MTYAQIFKALPTKSPAKEDPPEPVVDGKKTIPAKPKGPMQAACKEEAAFYEGVLKDSAASKKAWLTRNKAKGITVTTDHTGKKTKWVDVAGAAKPPAKGGGAEDTAASAGADKALNKKDTHAAFEKAGLKKMGQGEFHGKASAHFDKVHNVLDDSGYKYFTSTKTGKATHEHYAKGGHTITVSSQGDNLIVSHHAPPSKKYTPKSLQDGPKNWHAGKGTAKKFDQLSADLGLI